MTTEPADAAPEPTRAERIAAELTTERDRLVTVLERAKRERTAANTKVAETRAELAEVDRLLAATKPRTRTRNRAAT